MGVKRDRDSAGMSNNVDVSNVTITEDEAALYDRQIRLWGLDCQKRLREAKILMIGLNGLGVEVVKNLTLCGVKSITLMDETPVSEFDYSAQFFAVGHIGEGRASASKSAIHELNPRVEVEVNPAQPSSLPPSFYGEFSAVFATGQSTKLLSEISRHCRDNKVHFFCGNTWGMYGWGFLDLLTHRFSKLSPVAPDGRQTTSFETFNYCPLDTALTTKVGAGFTKRVNKVYPLLHILNDFHEQHGRFPSPTERAEDMQSLKKIKVTSLQKLGITDEDRIGEDMLSWVFGELSPVCAAVGGIMADQIIKGISRKGVPIHNFLLFDGDSCIGATEKILA